MLPIVQNLSYELQKIPSGVLPIYQSHQKVSQKVFLAIRELYATECFPPDDVFLPCADHGLDFDLSLCDDSFKQSIKYLPNSVILHKLGDYYKNYRGAI